MFTYNAVGSQATTAGDHEHVTNSEPDFTSPTPTVPSSSLRPPASSGSTSTVTTLSVRPANRASGWSPAPPTQAANAASYTKTIGAHQVTISQPDGTNFEFRGANTDSTRAIPGGDTSMSFLVSDFIATRAGAINIQVTGLAAGNYRFRSWHLDTFTGSALGFAQGSSTTVPNLIEAQVGGLIRDAVEPTALGSVGLNTTFINNSQIPTLDFPISHDGGAPLTIRLRAIDTNGSERFLLLNGFDLSLQNP